MKAGIIARDLFQLLRHDVDFCAGVSTVDQAGALRGVSAAKLTGREAQWYDGKPDFVGPRFDAAWAGSPEAAVEAERVKNYTESLRKKLRGA